MVAEAAGADADQIIQACCRDIGAGLVGDGGILFKAQNDWQFPDPRFGTLMRGSAAPSVADERRYRSAISPPFSPPAETRIRAPQQHDRRRGRLRRR